MGEAPHVEVLGRRQCGLCDEAKAVVRRAAESGLCTWESVDVDCDKALLVKYGLDVPVIRVDGKVRFMHHLNEEAFGEVLLNSSCLEPSC